MEFEQDEVWAETRFENEQSVHSRYPGCEADALLSIVVCYTHLPSVFGCSLKCSYEIYSPPVF